MTIILSKRFLLLFEFSWFFFLVKHSSSWKQYCLYMCTLATQITETTRLLWTEFNCHSIRERQKNFFLSIRDWDAYFILQVVLESKVWFAGAIYQTSKGGCKCAGVYACDSKPALKGPAMFKFSSLL